MSHLHARLRAVVSLGCGAVFGVGLAVAQMTDPRKVLAFLDVSGAWDPSLLLVLGGAVILAATTFHRILRRPAPQFDARFHLPESAAIDGRLISGAALFGIGWGLAGYCPGPAIAALGFGNPEALWLVPSLLAGIALQQRLDHLQSQAALNSLDVLEIKN